MPLDFYASYNMIHLNISSWYSLPVRHSFIPFNLHDVQYLDTIPLVLTVHVRFIASITTRKTFVPPALVRQVSRLTASSESRAALDSLDVWYSRPYVVRNCGSYLPKVEVALHRLLNSLRPVLHDISLSPPSPAFKTLFKDAKYAPYVKEVLTNITTGAALLLEDQISAESPELICISRRGELEYHIPGSKQLTDHYDHCLEGATASIVAGTPYILLCPSVFALPLGPTNAPCPYVNRWRNRYSNPDEARRLVDAQIYELAHVLARFYIYGTTKSRVDEYPLNDCLWLKGEDARGNARSYEFYMASMFTSSFLLSFDRWSLTNEDSGLGEVHSVPKGLWR